MMTIEQMRAARAALNLSVHELAGLAGLPPDRLMSAEAGEENLDIAAAKRIRLLLEARGIVFLAKGQADPGVGPGIRWRNTLADEGIRPENLSSANDG